MARFPANPHRRASYKQSSFAVKVDGEYVRGVTRVSGLTRTTDVVAERGGVGDAAPTSSPGLTNYAPIVLERGRSHDDAFESWANEVYDLQGADSGATTSLTAYEKDVVVELRNAGGQVAMVFHVHRAWPSSYTALSELDANESGLAVERLVLQHAGWERDRAVTEPTERSLDGVKRPSGGDGDGEGSGDPTGEWTSPVLDQPFLDVGRWQANPDVLDRWRAEADESTEADDDSEKTAR